MSLVHTVQEVLWLVLAKVPERINLLANKLGETVPWIDCFWLRSLTLLHCVECHRWVNFLDIGSQSRCLRSSKKLKDAMGKRIQRQWVLYSTSHLQIHPSRFFMVIVNCLYHLVSGSFCMHVAGRIICSINLLFGGERCFPPRWIHFYN